MLIYALHLQLKPGGRIPEKGKKIIVLVKNIKDLSRDVIKVCHLSSSLDCKEKKKLHLVVSFFKFRSNMLLLRVARCSFLCY